MSRTLNDDFDDDDLPGGPIDLEKGSQVGSGAATSYGGDGMDFDDDPFGDGAGAGAALELDMPGGGPSHKPPPTLSKAPLPPPPHPQAGGPAVPDLAFDGGRPPSSRDPQRTSGAHALAAPPPSSSRSIPSPQSSGSLGDQARTSGAHQAHTSGAHQADAPRPSSSGQFPQAPGSDPRIAAAQTGPAPPNHAAIIGKYPAPPQKIWQAPVYSVKVILRQFEIRSDLESLRRRRSPDVPLYERALASYDGKSFMLGLAINIAVFTIATFIFFLPVFIRFLRND